MPLPAGERVGDGGEWGSFVDHLTALEAAGFSGTSVNTIDDVPPGARELWAEVQVDIIDRIRRPAHATESVRALKLLLLSPALFLRTTAHGGARGLREIMRRFALWRTGEHAELLDSWNRRLLSGVRANRAAHLLLSARWRARCARWSVAC